MRPIGTVFSGLAERADAPQQPTGAPDAPGRVRLVDEPWVHEALQDLDRFRVIWLVVWFDRNHGFKPLVTPPRTPKQRRGVFATRSPYRPNPIGLSAVELVERRGLEIVIRGHDLLDGTPVLDIKPYIAYADARPDAGNGWLDDVDDALGTLGYAVFWNERAAAQATWIHAQLGLDLRRHATRELSMGPDPHPYRRIQRKEGYRQLAIRDWRVRFEHSGATVFVTELRSGYRDGVLNGVEPDAADPRVLELHRRFRGTHFP